jgi:hypothetical protein
MTVIDYEDILCFECPVTKEGKYTLLFCESSGFGTGCIHKGTCEVYQLVRSKVDLAKVREKERAQELVDEQKRKLVEGLKCLE